MLREWKETTFYNQHSYWPRGQWDLGHTIMMERSKSS